MVKLVIFCAFCCGGETQKQWLLNSNYPELEEKYDSEKPMTHAQVTFGRVRVNTEKLCRNRNIYTLKVAGGTPSQSRNRKKSGRVSFGVETVESFQFRRFSTV